MRLWHHLLIRYLPRTQLLAQWRELNSIFKNQDKHILINYIYEYPKEDLFIYSNLVINEMQNRGYKIKSFDNYEKYFNEVIKVDFYQPFQNHHNFKYLMQCFFNLQEKYDRGQQDFDSKTYKKMSEFIVDLTIGKKERRYG